MADFRLPLSGPVTLPWTAYFDPSGNQVGLFNINIGQSSNTEIEKDALSLASYGRQLGRIGDALIVLLRHITLKDLSAEEEKAIIDLKCMLHEMANVKAGHGAKHILRPHIE
ncbi:hypothetical protein [Acidisphaera sp. L21]|jgi:hypothetical protein|uniref:hypothetical protein n=1 Tax=Acidisphaera sp. L21 TaxID=1641851 RepID=UPI00131C4030|nr:hypothetical protein [Acidisphaera sp. L21]